MLAEMRNVSKAFGHVQALDGVTIQVDAGEVLGLVGDNAAGKSTLMKILAGAYHADSGAILWDGGTVRIDSPADSRALGIEMVYQDLALCDNLDVAANVFLGRETKRGWQRDDRGMERATLRMVAELGVSVPNVREIAGNLSGGQRQAVAIGRALAFNARLVILDEPTAALSQGAAEHVLDMVRGLRDRGRAVIFISHRPDDVGKVADRVVMLRHGRVM